jgi:arabinofuranan 3-O-arabinosyltransferase
MRERRQDRIISLALVAGAYALAFAQRPGLATSDTKIDLYVSPGRFLADAASTWSSSGDLGHVQGGQTSGYLFPMGPFFALGHSLGLSPWVVQRLWLGTLLALGAWGVVRLLDALLDRRRGVAHLVAGAVAVVNPFVVIYANRTTVTLLATAVLPWLLLAVHRGVRDPHGWRWPTVFALLVTASGGGVNGAVTFFMLLAPAMLLVYELMFAGVSGQAARGFALRAVPATLLASLWWLVPAYIQSSYGTDFLRFTEQPGTIWGTTSATESLRLMGFWDSYLAGGFGGHLIPAFTDAHALLFDAPVVVATLMVPALALTGFVWTRRWRYGPFFLALALLSVLVMIAGFPEGTPLRHGLTFTYNRVAGLRVLRTTYKAGAVLAIALACLAGVGAEEAWRRLASRSRPHLWRGALGVGAAAIVALAGWPLVTGRAQDPQVSWKRIPAPWRTAAADLDRQLPANARAAVLPGALFAFYRWGGTVDPILPALSRRPVAERSIAPYADLHATDLLWTTDGLIQQRRLLPGQLTPLLALLGVRQVVTSTDDDPERSGAIPPAAAASELAGQGLGTPSRSYGPSRAFSPAAAGDLGPAPILPQVRRYDLPAARGLVRVEPAAAPLVVDGSAGALAELAAFGALPGAQRPILYAGDLSDAQIRQAASPGAQVVVSDSNRRRAFFSASLQQNTGATLTAGDNVSKDGVIFDPFARGSAAQTVAVLRGVRYLLSPFSPQRQQFPEHRPFAAFDGAPGTAWLADPVLDPGRWWLEVGFQRPRDVPFVDLLPYSDAGGVVRGVQIAGRSFAVHPGWNRLVLGLRGVASLRVLLSDVRRPRKGGQGAGGIAELRIPGVTVSEALRLPTVGARALAGLDLRRSRLTYLFERTTGDDPYRRNLLHGPWSLLAVSDAGDAESVMHRIFTLPEPRSFTADAWVSVAAGTPDSALDRLAGYRGPVAATSSSRFQGRPAWRASSALDGDPASAWIGGFVPGQTAWLQWRSAHPMQVARLTLTAPREAVRRPTLVRIRWPGGSTPPLAVASDGQVTLPRPVRARLFRIEILSAAFVPGTPSSERDVRAVGIAEVRGVDGLQPIRMPRRRSLAMPCGGAVVRVGGGAIPLRVTGASEAFESGSPLRALPCTTPLSLGAGVQHLAVSPGLFAVDELRLDSPPLPGAAGVVPGARVLDLGHSGQGRYDGVRVDVRGPSWLVLGESYDRGWRAWCNGRALGAPTVLDGYANGWRVGPGCRAVRFAFAPNGLALAGYGISALAILLCLVLAVVVSRRRRRPVPAAASPDSVGGDRPARRSPIRVGLAAVLTGLVVAFVFGIEAGVAAAPGVAFVLWRGIGARALTLAAGALLLVVVPIIYLLDPGDSGAGNQIGYAVDHMTAHWVGVAALLLLSAALYRSLAAIRPRHASSAR